MAAYPTNPNTDDTDGPGALARLPGGTSPVKSASRTRTSRQRSQQIIIFAYDNGMMLVFGPFAVDDVRRSVTKDGVPLRLTLRCVELLVALVRNPGKTLTKQQLVDLAWPDPEASDATLAQHVFLLRRALRHPNSEWIRTVPNIGYCFAGDVRRVDGAQDERSRAVRAYMESAANLRAIASERSLRSAIDLCTHAIALDEKYAKAFAMRASCRRFLAEMMHAEPLPCLQAAQEDAEAALARDSHDADVRIEAAFSAAMLHGDGSRAQRHLDAAEQLAPNHPEVPRARVWLALMDGRCDDALHHARTFGGALLGSARYMMRDFARAKELFDSVAEHDAASRVMRGACRLFTGDLSGALEDFRDVYYADGAIGVRHYALGLYIYTLAKAGDRKTAMRYVRGLQTAARRRYVSPMAMALAHLGLGNVDTAIEFVQDAMRRFDPWAAYVAVDPMLDELREHPKFSALERNAA